MNISNIQCNRYESVYLWYVYIIDRGIMMIDIDVRDMVMGEYIDIWMIIYILCDIVSDKWV